MTKNFNQKNIMIFGAAILIAALSRLVNHHWNFTAVGAAAFAFALLFPTDKKVFFIPLVSLLVSDMILGFHDTMLFVYGGYMLALLPFMMMSETKSSAASLKLQKVLIVLSGSLIFFVVSNFGVWALGQMYSQNLIGLIETYVMGLPFYKNQFLSDILLTPALFYSFKMMLSHQVAQKVVLVSAKSDRGSRSKI